MRYSRSRECCSTDCYTIGAGRTLVSTSKQNNKSLVIIAYACLSAHYTDEIWLSSDSISFVAMNFASLNWCSINNIYAEKFSAGILLQLAFNVPPNLHWTLQCPTVAEPTLVPDITLLENFQGHFTLVGFGGVCSSLYHPVFAIALKYSIWSHWNVLGSNSTRFFVSELWAASTVFLSLTAVEVDLNFSLPKSVAVRTMFCIISAFVFQ